MSFRFNFRSRLFILLLISGIFISMVISVISYHFLMGRYYAEIEKNARIEIMLRRYIFDDTLSRTRDMLRFLSTHFDPKPNDAGMNARLFHQAIEPNRDVMQIRYLDMEGNERLRFERPTVTSAEVVMTPSDALQNKKERPYFQAVLQTPPESIWTSALDLNIENGRMQTPYRPTLRLGTPLYDNTKLYGEIVLNLDMQRVLETVTDSSFFRSVIVDQSGDILKHPNAGFEWSRYLEKAINLHTLYPDHADMLLHSDSLYIPELTLYSGILFDNPFVPETLRLLLQPKTDIHDYTMTLLGYILLVNLLLVPLHFLLAYLLSLTYYRLVERQKRYEALLVQRSKMAAIGEMLSFIAHQWRQPLNVLSSQLMRLRTDIATQTPSKERLLESFDYQEHLLEHLSGTIDSFRNFYSPVTSTSTFSVNGAIERVLELIGPTLHDHGIDCSFFTPSDAQIEGHQNELMQVMLSIIHNATEILQERHIEKPLISIALESHNHEAAITICDNGGGVLTHPITDIFLPYYSRHQQRESSGIGLYISKLIIEEHFGGTLDVCNRDGGACFTILIRTGHADATSRLYDV